MSRFLSAAFLPLVALASPAAALTGASGCDSGMAQAAQLNGPALLEAAADCVQAGAKLQRNFLLHAAYLRFTVDMARMIPASQEDARAAMRHSIFLYYFSDGPDESEILRDPGTREQYFRLLDGWMPQFQSGYSPGWAVRSRLDEADYQSAIANAKTARRAYLDAVAQLVSDDLYYRLFERSREIRQSHNDGVIEQPDSDRLNDLRRQMSARAQAIGSPLAPHGAEELNPSRARFPPQAPAPDEIPFVGENDPVTQRCSVSAGWQSTLAGGSVSSIQITRSPEWGTIWRADIATPDQPVNRFICTSNTSSSMPLDNGSKQTPRGDRQPPAG